jgi:hypothetical protein
MKTRTDLRAGADELTACKKEKEYWMNQYNYMQSVLAKCGSTTPPTSPPPGPYPSTSGGYVGGIWYSDKSGACG